MKILIGRADHTVPLLEITGSLRTMEKNKAKINADGTVEFMTLKDATYAFN